LPSFKYVFTCANETKVVELRKSNPQGWLFEAFGEAYPELASRRKSEIMRIRLEKIAGERQSWQAEFHDEPQLVQIKVKQV